MYTDSNAFTLEVEARHSGELEDQCLNLVVKLSKSSFESEIT